MGNKSFGVVMVGIVMFIAPAFCAMWVVLAAVVNWHDALLVTGLIVMQYQVYTIRRESRAQADRAVRRVMRQHERETWQRWTPPASYTPAQGWSVPQDYDIPPYEGDERLTQRVA